MSEELVRFDVPDGETVLVPDVEIGHRVRATFAVTQGSEDPIAQWLVSQRALDEQPIRLALDLLRPGDRVLDVGAHIGSYSLAASAMGCPVISVEAARMNARLLRAAKEANGFDQMQIVNAVASDAEGSTIFVEHGPWGHVPHDAEHAGAPNAARLPAARLGDVIAQRGWDSVEFVKMDIEGSEPVALRGMLDVLRRPDRPAILIESNGPMLRYAGSSPVLLKQFLAACGYQLYLLDRHDPHQLVRVDPDALQVEAVVDYLACTTLPHERLATWSIVDGMSPEALVRYFALACSDRHASNRAYAAAALTEAPADIRDDHELRPVWSALALDVDASVRSTTMSRPQDLAGLDGRGRRPPRGGVQTGKPPRPWPVFKVLARRDLLVRYHRSVLGMAWAVLGPLLTVGALWAVLSQVFKTPRFGVPYIVYLLSGMTILQLGTQVVQQVGTCLVASEPLRTKIRMSARVIALAGTTSIVFYCSVLLASLLAVQLITGVGIPLTALLALGVLAMLLVASVGVGMLVASIAVRVNDTLAALTVAISIAGYATPTFYPIEIVPQPYRTIVDINPLTHFLAIFRSTVYDGEYGAGRSWVYIGATTVVAIVAGMLVFGRSAKFSVTRR
jgi:ABC-2 type transport system permease protein